MFGSTFIIELHANQTDLNWLRFFYLDGSAPEQGFKELHPTNCEHCTLQKFRAFAEPLIPENWWRECGFDWAAQAEGAVPDLATGGDDDDEEPDLVLQGEPVGLTGECTHLQVPVHNFHQSAVRGCSRSAEPTATALSGCTLSKWT